MMLFWWASSSWHRRQREPQQEEQQHRHKLLPPSRQQPRRRLFPLRRTPKQPPPSSTDMNLMYFLQQDCPLDVLPKILAYCGPHKIASLALVSRQWNTVIMNDATWRILCEELYKVSGI